MHIHKIDIAPKRLRYLDKRQLRKQFDKKVKSILATKDGSTRLKPRQPKSS